jgi:uncharacterized repeat protein (TIGR01451 family)
MKRNGSEAVACRGSGLWRSVAGMVAATLMAFGPGPASAANATMDLSFSQNPNPAVYASSASYTITLKNSSNNTINNVSLTVTAPSGASFAAPGPSCVLSTALPCSVSGVATSFGASGYQLPSGGTLTINVAYYMPAAMPGATFVLTAAGTSSNNSGGPNPAAYTTVSGSYPTVFAPPPPVYPNIQLTISHDAANTVLWSTLSCAVAPTDPDCGASYYGQYTVSVKNLDSVPIDASTKPFEVEVSSVNGTFANYFGCTGPCAPGSTSTRVKIAGLGASGSSGDSTAFTVLLKSPLKTQSPVLDATATAILGPLFNPAVAALSPAPSASIATALTDAALQTYASLVPTTGGSAKAKNSLDATTGKGLFSTRVDVPTYTLVNGTPINIALTVTPGTTACSSSSPQCLDTQADVQSSGNPVTFGGPNAPLDGSQLVITMVRDWTTLAKKPSSVFNATVWYTDSAGNRTVVKDCGSVDLTLAERCVHQRIDMTTSAKGVLTGGYLKFIIWARHNGIYSW